MSLRRIATVCSGLVLGGLLSFAIPAFLTRAGNASVPQAYVPSPELSAESVVERQLDALRVADSQEDAIWWCYQFAAPRNRQVVGSVDDFRLLLQEPEYVPLIDHQERLIGRKTIVDDLATVLVTVIDKNGNPAVFRFVLERQQETPYNDCWMTTSVYPIGFPVSRLPLSDRASLAVFA